MEYSRYENLTVEKSHRVGIVTLNRPQALNAVDAGLHQELEAIFEDVAKDDEIGVVVVTGAGRAFSAGGDLKSVRKSFEDPSLPRITMDGARRLVMNILNLEKPAIAAVNGDAVGLGATIALFCDIVIASENARFGDTHVRVGVAAGDGGAVIWPLLVGVAKAKEMLLTGDLISAREAERIGLINRVVPPDELMPQAMALANRLASGASKAVQWTKLCINKRLREEMNIVLDASLALEWLTMQMDDHREAIKAFVEKRAPRFKGA